MTVLNVVTPVDASMSGSGVLDAGEERRDAARERAERLVADARERAAGLDGRGSAGEAGVPTRSAA